MRCSIFRKFITNCEKKHNAFGVSQSGSLNISLKFRPTLWVVYLFIGRFKNIIEGTFLVATF